MVGGELLKHVLGHGQHAASAAGSVVDQIGAGLDLVGDGEEDQFRHQGYGVARGPVFARLLVVLLVEAPDQLLEDRAHAVVVEAGVPDRAVGVVHRSWAQVDVGGSQLFDQRAEGIGPRQPRDLIAELEVFEDVLDVGREPVEPSPEVGFELLAIGAGAQVTQGKLGGIVEGLSRDLSQGWILFDDAGVVEGGPSCLGLLACCPPVPTASSRRSTVIGRITSRYLPRTYRSRRTSSAMPQM